MENNNNNQRKRKNATNENNNNQSNIKKTRVDTRIEKKNYNIRCNKSLLKSVIKKKFLKQMKKIVIIVNDIVYHSYNFLKLYILKKYHDSRSTTIPTINLKLIQDIMSCLYRHQKSDKGVEELTRFYTEEYQFLTGHAKQKASNISHILSYSEKKIYTEYTTNIKEHFEDHFRRYVNITTKDLQCEKNELNDLKLKLLQRQAIHPKFKNWYLKYLEKILPIPANEKHNYSYDLKKFPFKYLVMMMNMSEILENGVNNNSLINSFIINYY